MLFFEGGYARAELKPLRDQPRQNVWRNNTHDEERVASNALDRAMSNVMLSSALSTREQRSMGTR
jgi:hypothetical protein